MYYLYTCLCVLGESIKPIDMELFKCSGILMVSTMYVHKVIQPTWPMNGFT